MDFRLLLERKPWASARLQADTTQFSVLLPALTTIGYRLRGTQASDRPEPPLLPITREGLYN